MIDIFSNMCNKKNRGLLLWVEIETKAKPKFVSILITVSVVEQIEWWVCRDCMIH
jgi:hypothetical protein